MIRHRVMLLLLVIPFWSNAVSGQVREKITEQFFSDFAIDKVKAYEKLFENAKWVEKSSIETVKINYKEYLGDLGEYLGYELITEKHIGESYALKSFLLKFESRPIRFTFTLYKPKSDWQIQSFSYDSDLSEELEESAKAYRLKYNL